MTILFYRSDYLYAKVLQKIHYLARKSTLFLPKRTNKLSKYPYRYKITPAVGKLY